MREKYSLICARPACENIFISLFFLLTSILSILHSINYVLPFVLVYHISTQFSSACITFSYFLLILRVILQNDSSLFNENFIADRFFWCYTMLVSGIIGLSETSSMTFCRIKVS